MSVPGPAVRLEGVSKSYGRVTAADDVHLELAHGELLAILGPSGCGKTTCLRLIAGFERPDSGSIEVSGRRVVSATSSVPPERRKVGMVFQDLALFPHLSVRDNVAYGIRRDPDRRVRTDELLELVGMAGHASLMPHQLSGGMRQRVALARALAPRPEVILLDEPFSSLDRVMRTQLRVEVREILRAASQSAIFVTHDQAEALTMADRVAVMNRGRILQSAPPELIYGEPATPFVATFIGVANLVHAQLVEGVGLTRFGPVRLVGPSARRPDGAALCLLRPEHFSVREAPDGPVTTDSWQVTRRSFSGSEILLELVAADGERIWVEAGDRVRHLGIGDRVVVRLRDVESVAFGRSTRDADTSTHPRPAVAGPVGGEGPPGLPVPAVGEPSEAARLTGREGGH